MVSILKFVMKQKLKTIFLFGVCVIWGLGSCVFAAPHNPAERSLNEFSQGLQSLADSSNSLVEVNDQLIEQNRPLKKNYVFLERQLRSLGQNNAQLEKELIEYEDKTKDKLDIMKQNQAKVDEAKARLVKIDQEIVKKEISLAERQKQQDYVFKLLAITNRGGTTEQDIQMIQNTQAQLVKQANEGRERLKRLENEWQELSFWYGDSSASMPKLTATRDQLKERLGSLKKLGVFEQWRHDQSQIQKLDREVKGLVKRHSNYLGALKVIENEYIGNKESAQSLADDKKLQRNLGQLKKDNKTLQKQAADLRLEMVEWDKKKSTFEHILGQNK